MKRAVLRAFKKGLTWIGCALSGRAIHQLKMVLNYVELGRWMADHGFDARRRVTGRNAVFRAVSDRVRDQQVLYLEFGVFQGASMRYWSDALKNPQSILHGFDSFEGLPEDFDAHGPYRKGTFSTQGAIPVIHDRRVRFFKGWFDQVLPEHPIPEHDVLVMVMDADLYSSTIFVLRRLRPWIHAGTYIYFDDMSRPEHEPRAFDEFMKESGLKFSLISADHSLNYAFFQCQG